MNSMLRMLAVAVGLGALVIPVTNADAAPPRTPLTKPKVERVTPRISAMRATLNADGTVTRECVDAPFPAQRKRAADATPVAPKQER